nr:PREDICTED: tRNA:m(4)X modification enzyme TRM13 homolog isoform X3 [Anolis carolinensis]|eukprot:XP_016848601.1 PREDICTED: tRNA:m(4)X modification enzyme TRM13 homolog isoform X3 [Anolis carolinensis]
MAAAEASSLSPPPGRCAFFVERKKRFCKMVPAQGRRFCGEHGVHEEEKSRKRIPCPLDPKHFLFISVFSTVYEDQLQKHLKKCNSREKPKPVYFAQDINAGPKDATESLEEEQVSISALSKEELEDLIRKLRRASTSISNVIKDQILCHQALQNALSDPKNGDAATKHLKQQVDGKHSRNSFERLQVDIQHLCLNKVPVLAKEKLPVVGIGKHVCGAATDLALRCLVETYAKHYDNREEDPAPKRLKTDETNETSFCPDETCTNSVSENWSPVAGIVIALCCHHRCDWKHYVGQEFFTAAGLGATEFNYFRRMASWATCGLRETARRDTATDGKNEEQSNEAEEHEEDDNGADSNWDSLQGLFTAEERKQIGRRCKLLIDHGRIEYLQQRGYEAVLQRYTDLSVSLENVLLTAVPCQS